MNKSKKKKLVTNRSGARVIRINKQIYRYIYIHVLHITTRYIEIVHLVDLVWAPACMLHGRLCFPQPFSQTADFQRAGMSAAVDDEAGIRVESVTHCI